MKKFFNLLNFEFNRFFKIYGSSLLIIFIGQALIFGNQLMETSHDLDIAMQQTGNNISEVSQILGAPLTMNTFLLSSGYRLIVFSILFVLLFYVFFTWYRDWQGKNTFIYRLLMLPIGRMQLFWSKSLVFVIGGLCYIAFQYVTVALFQRIALWIIPQEFITALPVHTILQKNVAYSGFPPTTPFLIFSVIGFCYLWLTHLFAVILMERAYGVKGIIAGLIYLPLMGAIQANVFFLNISLLASELVLYTLAFSFITWVFSLLVIHYLIKSKVTV